MNAADPFWYAMAAADASSVASRLGRAWGRVKDGHDEFTYPRQTPLPTGGRERTLWRLGKALKVPVTELLE